MLDSTWNQLRLKPKSWKLEVFNIFQSQDVMFDYTLNYPIDLSYDPWYIQLQSK